MFAKHVNPEISFFGMDLTNVMSVLDLVAIKQQPYNKHLDTGTTTAY